MHRKQDAGCALRIDSTELIQGTILISLDVDLEAEPLGPGHGLKLGDRNRLRPDRLAVVVGNQRGGFRAAETAADRVQHQHLVLGKCGVDHAHLTTVFGLHLLEDAEADGVGLDGDDVVCDLRGPIGRHSDPSADVDEGRLAIDKALDVLKRTRLPIAILQPREETLLLRLVGKLNGFAEIGDRTHVACLADKPAKRNRFCERLTCPEGMSPHDTA
ncbi:hypothetical protein D9M72_359630 [compost metagenome]